MSPPTASFGSLASVFDSHGLLMKTDHLAYQLATRVSWAGLVLHTVVAVVTLIAGIVTPDDATRAAGYFAIAGIPVWACLIFVFHQHKLERLESLEAEALAAGGARSSTIFELSDDDLNVAARRLRWMHKFFVPTVSLVVAALFGSLGWWQYSVMSKNLAAQTIEAGIAAVFHAAGENSAPWLLAVSVAAAAALFIFSRYVSGMSQQPAWRDLRGGASAAVGVSLVHVALAVGHACTLAGVAEGMRIVALAIPIFTLAVGAEIAANFVLNLYRPRRAGEFPRAAFDSRILSLVAAPDTIAKSISDAINYQFGFEVSSTWFYRLLSRQIGPLVGFAILLFIALNCVGVIQPYERGIVLSFGRIARVDSSGNAAVLDSGLVFKWPWQRLEKYPVYRIQEAFLGVKPSDPKKAMLWGESHAATAEDHIVFGPAVQGVKTPAGTTSSADDIAANNFSVLNAEIPIFFQIRAGELMNYLNFVGGPGGTAEKQILAIAKGALTRHAATVPVDVALGPGRGKLADDLRDLIQADLNSRNAGIDVIFVGVAGIHPAKTADINVAEAFEEVLLAEQEREATILKARAAAVQQLAAVAGSLAQGREIAARIEALDRMSMSDPGFEAGVREIEAMLARAGGEAAKQILDAGAQRWNRHMEARSLVTQENARSAGFVAAPRLYEEREFLRMLVQTLAGARVVVTSPDIDSRVHVDLTEDPTRVDIGSSISRYEQTLVQPGDK